MTPDPAIIIVMNDGRELSFSEGMEKILYDLAAEGLLTLTEDGVQLTDAGRALMSDAAGTA